MPHGGRGKKEEEIPGNIILPYNPSIEIAGFMLYYSDEDTLSIKIANLRRMKN